MNTTEQKTEVIKYETTGTCCKVMNVAIADGVVQDAEFLGGCAGNLIGIKELIKGMTIDEVIAKFKGVPCGNKSTSCPDQLATCLMQYKASKSAAV